MHVSQFLVCFFLPFSVAYTSIDVNLETLLTTLENQVDHCREEEAVSLSKELSKVYQTINDKRTEKEKNYKKYISLVKNEQALYDEYTNLYSRTKKRVAMYMLQEQSLYPYEFNRTLKDESDILLRAGKRKDSCKEKLNRLLNKKEEIQVDLQKLEAYDKRVQEAQTTLFVQFGNQKHLASSKAKPDPHAIIQGTEDLPVYGAIEGSDFETHFSCLQENASISSTSLFWDTIIDEGNISAGTWSYPQGGLHLGIDLAAPMYSKIKAPANGIVLYADTPAQSDGGYLGNMEGWPYGGGNTLCVIVSVNEELYAVTFAHMSDTIYVTAGQQFSQGDLLALSGNSGNTTGPHTHIEIFKLHLSLKETIRYFMNGADFAFGCGWDKPATVSVYATRLRPEEILFI